MYTFVLQNLLGVNHSSVNKIQHALRQSFLLRSHFSVAVPKITTDEHNTLMLMIVEW